MITYYLTSKNFTNYLSNWGLNKKYVEDLKPINFSIGSSKKYQETLVCYKKLFLWLDFFAQQYTISKKLTVRKKWLKLHAWERYILEGGDMFE